MKLFLVRHGESIGNITKGFMAGRSDPQGLTPRGKTQIVRAAWELKNTSFSHIVSSPVARARESAEIISTLFQQHITYDDLIAEMSYGLLEGHLWWEVKHLFPEEFIKRKGIDFQTPYPSGESLAMVATRVGIFLEKLKTHAHINNNILIVSHKAIISTLMYWLDVGNPATNPEFFLQYIQDHAPSNSSINIIDLAQSSKKNIQSIMFEPVDATADSISFYMAGIHKQTPNSLIVTPLITFSQNRVFLSEGKQKQIIKVVSDHGTLGPRRMMNLYSFLKQETTIPGPRIVENDLSDNFFKDGVLIFRNFEGQTMENLIKTNLQLAIQSYSKLFQTVKNIHALSTDSVAKFWVPNDWGGSKQHIWNKYIENQIKRVLSSMHLFQLNQAAQKKVESQLNKLSSYLDDKVHLAPIHGDFAPQNIIINTSDNSLCVLDFDRARIGDPLWDLVYYLGWTERINKEAARHWRLVCDKHLSKQEIVVFELYRVLFHSWTVLDTLDYEGNRRRAEVADLSIKFLQN